MRTSRTLPEIARSIVETRETLRALLTKALEQESVSEEEKSEISRLETERHLFDAMCMRHAPMNLIASGYDWDDELRHEADPGVVARVRTNADVEISGEVMTIGDATKMLKTNDHGQAGIGGWTGAKGSVATMAGMLHPARTTAVDDAAASKTYDLFG